SEKLEADEQILCDVCRDGFDRVERPICPVCGHGPWTTKETSCSFCLKPPIYFERARSLFYYHPPLSDAILRLKSHPDRNLATALARYIFIYLEEELRRVPIDVIVPVPLHPWRERMRGYNQAELVALELGKMVGLPVASEFLRRIKRTAKQNTLPREQRRANVEGAFAVELVGCFEAKKILLFDDVITTGATGNDCARALKHEGRAEEVSLLTLARAG
ncbi:MAG: ComF family protein, partial [bacterium]